jgi:hypothetical protein
MQNNYELFMMAYPADSQMSEKISEVLMNNSDIDIWACAFEIEATESTIEEKLNKITNDIKKGGNL